MVFRQSSSCRLPGSEYFSATPSVVAIFGLGASTMSASFFTPGLLRSHLQLQRNGVFLLAIISSRCPSDLTSLRYDTLKTDCQTYLGHLIIIYCLPMGKDVCAILALGTPSQFVALCPLLMAAFSASFLILTALFQRLLSPSISHGVCVKQAFPLRLVLREPYSSQTLSEAALPRLRFCAPVTSPAHQPFFRHCLRPAASDSMTR